RHQHPLLDLLVGEGVVEAQVVREENPAGPVELRLHLAELREVDLEPPLAERLTDRGIHPAERGTRRRTRSLRRLWRRALPPHPRPGTSFPGQPDTRRAEEVLDVLRHECRVQSVPG